MVWNAVILLNIWTWCVYLHYIKSKFYIPLRSTAGRWHVQIPTKLWRVSSQQIPHCKIPLYDVPPRRLRQWRNLLRYSWSPTYDIVAILTNIQSLLIDSDPNSRMLRVRRGEGRDKEGVISCKACGSVFFYRYSSCSCILPSHNSDSMIPINATVCRHKSANRSNLRRSDILKRTPKSCRGSPISGSGYLHSIPVFLLPALRIQRVD